MLINDSHKFIVGAMGEDFALHDRTEATKRRDNPFLSSIKQHIIFPYHPDTIGEKVQLRALIHGFPIYPGKRAQLRRIWKFIDSVQLIPACSEEPGSSWIELLCRY